MRFTPHKAKGRFRSPHYTRQRPTARRGNARRDMSNKIMDLKRQGDVSSENAENFPARYYAPPLPPSTRNPLAPLVPRGHRRRREQPLPGGHLPRRVATRQAARERRQEQSRPLGRRRRPRQAPRLLNHLRESRIIRDRRTDPVVRRRRQLALPPLGVRHPLAHQRRVD